MFTILGNANLVYTIIRKRQVFFALSNLSTDTQTIAKLSTKNSSSPATSSKNSRDQPSNKQTVFQTNAKSAADGEPPLNKDITQQMNANSLGLLSNAMTTTLAETPCKSNSNADDLKENNKHRAY